MPPSLPRRGMHHASPDALLRMRSRRRVRGLRLAILGGPVLVIAGAVIAAPALSPAAAPTRTPDALGGPVTVTPNPTPAGPTNPPHALPTAPPTPTPAATQPPGPTSKPPEELSGYVWPLRNARLTSPFGPRDDGPILIDGQRYHEGMDLATWCGDKVRAAHSGTILYAGRKFDEHLGYSGPLDNFYARMQQIGGLVRWLPIVVVIDDGNGYRSLYAHLSKAIVEAGDVVDAGDVIGYEGATGRATGCHLHYALIRMDGPWLDIVPDFVTSLRYPPRVRERIDPFRVLPLTHSDAPLKVQRRYRIPFDRLPYTLEHD